MKAHLRTSFLNVDESCALCDEVPMNRKLALAAGSGKSLTLPTQGTAEMTIRI